jgi:predicted aspartyl protease
VALEKHQLQHLSVDGRIDEQGRVLLPVIVIASDGLELEVEAAISLQFHGAMAVHPDVARRLGWRRLGTRRVVLGFETVLMDHYLGTMSLGGLEPSQHVVLGGIKDSAIIGQKMLSGRQLRIDFADSRVTLD